MLLDPQTDEVNELLVAAFNLDREAKKVGVNAFDNNLVREVIICRQADLLKNMGRGETDAYGRHDNAQYELKSTDIRNVKSSPSWPTSREVTPTVLAAFRSMDAFLFGVFHGIDLLALFRARPVDLEPFFADLERKLNARTGAGKNLNNPKIPWSVIEPVCERLLIDPSLSGVSWL